jgi:hypothetical protein
MGSETGERERGRDKGVERPGGRTWESAVAAGRHGTGQHRPVSGRAPRPSPPGIAAADRTTIIGIHWEHIDRGGRDRIYFVQGAEPCAKGRAWQIGSLDKSWDALVSSAEAFGGCGTFIQYAQTRFKGVTRTCSPYCDALGPLNDRVLSIRWRA